MEDLVGYRKRYKRFCKSKRLKFPRYNFQIIYKFQIPNKIYMIEYNYNLEERTTEFGKRIIRLCKVLIKDQINLPIIEQIVRSAGSVGANYREANDSLGNKDFLYRIRISRKECKESLHWLELIEEANPEIKSRMQNLKQETKELKNILSTIILKKEKITN